ncbi:calcium/proton exchanger [Desulfosporosinus sp. PR]|uniref:calcium/proton exchanger n=1 Tax=Candidatus Desulfosporosinus nitrosoreducens TaxID=3401928 RepID=UPI0027F0895A|nr:calcium/proton exchanger [Desulfosporosinus sp. PR]MDQ7093707.1 calcium/proton exchanger [Desulfosporosinus sp. PR]
MKFLNFFLLAIPLSIFLHFTNSSPSLVFLFACLSIIPLSGYMGKATEEIAIYVGPSIGGLLNATFGNAAELIITVFALKSGLLEVVKASITGSIIGNLLLVLGLSMLIGGFKFKTQKFNRAAAGMHTSMLLLAVTGLIIPAIFLNSHANPAAEPLSLGVAAVLILVYLLSLLFSLHTHKDVFRPSQEHSETPKWSRLKALLILLIATLFVVIESEFLVAGIEPVVKTLGISELFIGVIVIPIIGNAAEHSTSVMMALKNKMEISLEIAIGSSTQIALFVAPLLVFIGYLIGRPLDLLFTSYELIVIILGTVITAVINMDGRSNWLEGAQLLAAYVIMALAFLFI